MPRAVEIMDRFAALTGLVGDRPPQRYLWTDAFAVCNFLELHRQNSTGGYLELARRLVDQVHHVLGRHRPDDEREGWISGLDQEEGEARPTAGGLRIGKPQNERPPDAPRDERREWEQDGQYYHYLTKWMHALHRVATDSAMPVYDRWAGELAAVAHRAFRHTAAAGPRLYWKMRIDLSAPLVESMGHHDPLDGLITCLELAAGEKNRLADEIGDLQKMVRGRRWTTPDPLGIGGLLFDLFRATRLAERGRGGLQELVSRLMDDASASLEAYHRSVPRAAPAERRLAFRELGLSIGLRAVKRLGDGRKLLPWLPLADDIEAFWLRLENRQAATWTEHRHINMVMLATSLAPDGFLAV